MTDIVDDLRRRAETYNTGTKIEELPRDERLGYYDSICAHDDLVAADEIERLREANEELKETLKWSGKGYDDEEGGNE